MLFVGIVKNSCCWLVLLKKNSCWFVILKDLKCCWLVLLEIIAVVLLHGVADRNKCCWLVMLKKEGGKLLVGLVEKLVVVTGCCC